MKLLLIDANNLAFRVHWTHRRLVYNTMPVGLLFGFFRSLISFKRNFPEHQFVIAWDGGYKRRLEESEKAVEQGMIKSSYKANRREMKELDPMIANVFEQMQPLQEALKLFRVLQVTVKGFEADDVIYSYVKKNKDGENLVVTTDKDYYQLIGENTSVYDAMKNNLWTKKVFMDSYGFEPELWVDVGALSGDSGDNIISVNGIGEKTAVKLVKEFGNIDQIFDGLEKRKINKKEQSILHSKPLIRLAKSLKQMDIVDNIPDVKIAPRNETAITELFGQYGFESIITEGWRLC